MINITTLIILGLMVVILGYTTVNLFIKLEKLEDELDAHYTFFDGLLEDFKQASVELNKVDQRGSFESDDEVGFFFKYLKQVQQELEQILNIYPNGKEE